ncbi:hypothetical protein FHL15_006600 [Xylaria flabelliformis]|uniref:FUN14 domain-containing protein n=1 Tax=Xylaria flabelliformis TaxID=2512241 RepID=A0A553HWV9_9PEZI|nr:hypothetical protein FHL15_006600 [Xylaria flabelliformis]
MSSTRVFQATRLLTRQRRQVLVGSCLGLSVGTGVSMRWTSPRVRFDTHAHAHSPLSSDFSTSSPAFSRGDREETSETLNPELMKQLSGGSVTGFLAGMLVSVFSRTLVLLLGVSVVVIQVAAKYGINIIDQLRLKQRLGKSRVLEALEKDPMFKLSFGIFFALSAFMQF